MTDFVADLKRQPGGTIVKYGNGPLDRPLMENNLIDEFHLLLTPVAAGSGQHLFEEIKGAPQLSLADIRRFASGVLVLVYTRTEKTATANTRHVTDSDGNHRRQTPCPNAKLAAQSHETRKLLIRCS